MGHSSSKGSSVDFASYPTNLVAYSEVADPFESSAGSNSSSNIAFGLGTAEAFVACQDLLFATSDTKGSNPTSAASTDFASSGIQNPEWASATYHPGNSTVRAVHKPSGSTGPYP